MLLASQFSLENSVKSVFANGVKLGRHFKIKMLMSYTSQPIHWLQVMILKGIIEGKEKFSAFQSKIIMNSASYKLEDKIFGKSHERAK